MGLQSRFPCTDAFIGSAPKAHLDERSSPPLKRDTFPKHLCSPLDLRTHPMANEEPETNSPFGIDEDLVQSPTHKIAQTGEIDFDGLLQPSLILHQDLANGNGGQAWPAGMVLTKYLLRKKRDELQQSTMSVFDV